MSSPNFQKLNIGKNNYIAYHKHIPSKKRGFPTAIFLSGYASDMEGTKAIHLENFCKENDIGFIRFDYLGTGKSSGEFLDGSISIWKENVIQVVDNLTGKDEQILLIGSSMGGWLMLLSALHYIEKNNADKVHSIIGLSSAPDFTEDLMWNLFTESQQKELMKEGRIKLPTDYCDDPEDEDNHYIITKKLIKDGRRNILLKDDEKMSINCKITLLHGSDDQDVPYKYSIKIADKVQSKDTEVIIKQNTQHRFSEPEDLELLIKTLKNHIMVG